MTRDCVAGLALTALVGAVGPATAAVFHSQLEALAIAFPRAERIERRSYVLTHAQAEAIRRLARAPLDSPIVSLHTAWRGEDVLGYAVIDVHTVRTLSEALLVALTPDGSVRSVLVLAFHEPAEYLPPGRWLRQFEGRALSPSLQLQRGVHALGGATLSARAVTRSIRRALALVQVLIHGTAEKE